MNKVKKIYLILSILVSLSFINADELEKKLIGVWQNSPELAAGWSDTYQFFSNKNFIFNFNQMDFSKRVVKYSGKWEITNNTLVLTIQKITIIFNGQFTESEGSSASEFELINGNTIEVEIKPVKLVYKISNIKMDEDEPEEIRKYIIDIDGVRYWRFYSNPNEYK